MISSLHGMVKYKRRVKVNRVKFLLVCSNSSCSRSLIRKLMLDFCPAVCFVNFPFLVSPHCSFCLQKIALSGLKIYWRSAQ